MRSLKCDWYEPGELSSVVLKEGVDPLEIDAYLMTLPEKALGLLLGVTLKEGDLMALARGGVESLGYLKSLGIRPWYDDDFLSGTWGVEVARVIVRKFHGGFLVCPWFPKGGE